MHRLRPHLAEVVSYQICNQLTAHIDYHSLRLQLEGHRT